MTAFDEHTDEHVSLTEPVEFTPAALSFVRDWANQFRGGAFVASIVWFENDGVVDEATGEVAWTGPLLDLAATARRSVPKHHVRTIQGVEIMVQIPRAVRESHPRIVIDLDEDRRFHLR